MICPLACACSLSRWPAAVIHLVQGHVRVGGSPGATVEMNKFICALFLVLVVTGCVTERSVSDLATLQALDFAVVRSGEVARIKGEGGAFNAFHGYRLISGWRALEEKPRRELAAVLADLIRGDLAAELQPRQTGEELIHLHSFCFDPGYAVRLKTDRGRRDFLICLECDEVHVFDDVGHFWARHLEKPEAGKIAGFLGRF
jgi:hypothetical protein